MGFDLGRLANQRDIAARECPTRFSGKRYGVFEKDRGIYTFPLWVSWWKVIANITERCRTQNGIGQSVPGDISIGMPGQFLIMRDEDAAQGHGIAGFKRMDVKPTAKSWGVYRTHKQFL